MAGPRRDEDPTEWLQVGPGRARSRRSLVPVIAAVACGVVLIGGGVVAVHQHTVSAPEPAPTQQPSVVVSSRSPRSTPSGPAAPSALGSPASRRVVLTSDAPFLPGSADYEVIGYGPDGVVRIQPDRGRVIRTSAPALDVGTQVSVVAGRGFVLVHPTDGDPGYLVLDRETARRPTGVLLNADFIFPGPDADHVWVTTEPAAPPVPGLGQVRVLLTDLDGRRTGSTLPLPFESSAYSLSADGTGFLVAAGTSAFYLSRPAGLSRITTGALLAAGPTRWLTNECDRPGRCAMHVVDRRTGKSHALTAKPPTNVVSRGQVSPDGRWASVSTLSADGEQRVVLVDLATGTQREFADTSLLSQPQGIVWSPDSRWLLVAGADQVLRAIDPGSGEVVTLSADIPPVVVIAVRASTEATG